jgi:UDP-glucose 4-epimerase
VEGQTPMNVLVTGGSGFIGRHVVDQLHQAGHVSTLYDRPRDVRDRGTLWELMPGVDAVIHLAGLLGTSELFEQVQEAISVNVGGTATVLEACREFGASYVGITMPDAFPSIYTATKVASQRLASAFHHAYGVPVCHVCAFNAYGPGQKHGPGHPRKIIPAFATEAWDSQPITIWGDGEQSVDLIYAPELARVLVEALDMSDDSIIDGGSGEAWTVNRVADFVLDITGSTAGVRHLPMRRGEQPTMLCAKGEGWEYLSAPPSSDHEASLAATILTYR